MKIKLKNVKFHIDKDNILYNDLLMNRLDFTIDYQDSKEEKIKLVLKKKIDKPGLF